MTKEEIRAINPDAKFYMGFDDAIIGTAQRIDVLPVAAYDFEIMISILSKRDEMTYDEAKDYIEYNITGGWLGDGTPITIEKTLV